MAASMGRLVSATCGQLDRRPNFATIASKRTGELDASRARTTGVQNCITLRPIAHSAAATAHCKGDHLTAHELSKQAFEHSKNAH